LVGLRDSPEAELIQEAAAADDIEVIRAADAESIHDTYATQRPALVILDRDAGGLDACRSIRALGDEQAREVPIIVVAPEPGDEGGVTDWLVTPFSVEYARSRIRAWLQRVGGRWIKAPIPRGEAQRLAALHELDLLDTEAEERFDRITRLAAGLLGTPVALVTLIDRERQWFKSRVGTPVTETPREVAFCAHAILGDEPLVVPDALEDDRFADNPAVTGPPHIRFYAGCPVTLPDGYSVGTLCVLDVRPRQLSEQQLGLLRDLANVVEGELARRL